MEETKKEESSKERKTNKVSNRRKKFSVIIFITLALIGAVTVYFYLRYKATHITTDDAFIEGHVHTVSSKVPGTVKGIYVRDNQVVKRGDLLIEVDPVDYDVMVKEALSGLNAERARLAEIEARIEASKKQLAALKATAQAAAANLELQKANLRQAELDIKRAEGLYKKGAIPKERYEKTSTLYDVTLAQVKASAERLREAEMAAESQRAVIHQVEASRTSQLSSIKEKEAKLEAAKLNYGYTKTIAPSDGYVTKKTVEIGNQVQIGQPLMAVVSLEDIWVVANYKETQLEKVTKGQKVKIKVDTYPGKVFRGKIDSIMAGTGAVFSLFPPENATGNYVKVVQRIPVKIVFDKDTDPEHVLRIGISVVPTVLIEK
ncbi:MAG: HlyD family secretion protein [Nitrospirota bacterium]